MQTATLIDPKTSALQGRLQTLGERTNDQSLQRLANGEPPFDGACMATELDRSDWISTCLMNAYKETGDTEVYALLFELNRGAFLQAIRAQLRRSSAAVDANDVLQEVFLNIYRYPGRFRADRANAFRGWGHRIVRNTLLRFLKVQARQPSPLIFGDEDQQPEDTTAHSPERLATDHESAEVVNVAFLMFLDLYLHHFNRLPQKDQRILTLAEIEGWSYRDIAREFNIPNANVKMKVFRCRRRIHRGLARSLGELRRLESVA